MAVLARTNARLDPVAKALGRAGMPVDRAGAGARDQREEAMLLSLLRAAVGRAAPVDLLRLLRRTGMTRAALRPLLPRLEETGSLAGLLGLLSRPRTGAAAGAGGANGAGAAVGARAGARGPVGRIQRLREALLEQGATAPEAPAASTLEAAARALSLPWPPEPGAPLLSHLWAVASAEPLSVSELLDRRAVEQPADRVRRAERVHLLTLHAAKGLEFEQVFIVGCEKGTLPWGTAWPAGRESPRGRSLREFRARAEVGPPAEGLSEEDSPAEGLWALALSEEALHEERRLLYVGMTRARSRLWLGAARSLRRHGVTRRCAVSPFLQELPEALLSCVEHERPRRRPRQQQMDLM
jgi:superfamily I DNA/RNA helicase